MSTSTLPTTKELGRTHLLPYISLEIAGVLTLLVGAWAAVVAFIGPEFSFSADGTGSWHWSLTHAVLFVVPGAIAFLAGLITVMGAPGDRRAVLALAGIAAVLCGAWLVVGVVAWPVIHGGNDIFTTTSSNTSRLEYWLGYSLGPGGLLIALGSFIVGRDHYSAARAARTPSVQPAAPLPLPIDLMSETTIAEPPIAMPPPAGASSPPVQSDSTPLESIVPDIP
ncbi:MAG TPA: hypothetical protein VGS21_09780 [Acidimicrobiales bacterium]|nr:hypothetical protein [Acidimicrobiales bacterium]